MARVLTIALVGVLAICAPASINAQRRSLPPIDADVARYYKLPDGRVINVAGRYYRNSRGQVREDFGSNSEIVDLVAGTITLVNHETRSARVFRVPKGGPALSQTPSVKRFGEGVVEGHRVSKTRVVAADGAKHELWTADDIGVVVMTRAETVNFVNTKALKNIKVQEPDHSKFAIPSGYSVQDVTAAPISGAPAAAQVRRQPQAQIQRR
jgi:hypothetical protein